MEIIVNLWDFAYVDTLVQVTGYFFVVVDSKD